MYIGTTSGAEKWTEHPVPCMRTLVVPGSRERERLSIVFSRCNTSDRRTSTRLNCCRFISTFLFCQLLEKTSQTLPVLRQRHRHACQTFCKGEKTLVAKELASHKLPRLKSSLCLVTGRLNAIHHSIKLARELNWGRAGG